MSADFTMASAGAARQSALNAVAEAVRVGDMATAMRLAAAAAAQGIAHPQILVLAAHEALGRGDGAAALSFAERACESAPRDGDVLNVLGMALTRMNRPREALKIYEAALRQAPGIAMLHFNKARALEDASELKAARMAFERALAIQPRYPEALARLANIAAAGGELEAARGYAERALKQDSRQVAAALALASVDVEEKKFEDAIARSSRVAQDSGASPINRSIALGLIGDAYHGLGKPAEAFAAYANSNTLQTAYFKPVLEAQGVEPSFARAKRLAAYFQTAPMEQWQARDAQTDSPVETHVFLVGFPRSGTTLLENVLAGHHDVETMEERDCLSDAIAAFIAPADGLARLAAMAPDDRELAKLRSAYWNRVTQEGFARKSKVFIDKLPLNLMLLPLVAKLFPNAKILFALRDPRDVVLSCFRRRFVMSAHMYELLTLDGAARFYDAVMGLAELYRARLGLDICDLKYESLVADFDGETARVCAFLGIAWREEMRDFAARARDVNTPSARQLARGLFTQGAGQWHGYARELAPVQPILAPWVARFGYGET